MVVCNIKEPTIDSYKVLNLLRNNPSTSVTPFILISEKNIENGFRKAMELGADDYFVKPFTPEELLVAIKNQLKKRTLIKQWFATEKQQRLKSSPNKNTSIDEFANFANFFSSSSLLKDIFCFIETHYHQSISLTDVAKHTGLSPSYLTKIVRDKTGETVNRWIVKRRMTAARILLLETELPVEQIAIATGYRSNNHFFNQFRQYYKTTPKAWRKRHVTLQGVQDKYKTA